MKLSLWFRLVRLPNLFLAAFSMLLLFMTIIVPYLVAFNLYLGLLLILEMITVMMIMAGGNIYNDICDQETDKINRSTVIIGRHITPGRAYLSYWITLTLSILLTGLIVLISGNWLVLLIHILAIIGLYSYSSRLKGTPFWGNLIIALLCAMVFPVIPILYSGQLAFDWWKPENEIAGIVFLFSAFSIFSTLWRELVKDLEDQEGDRRMGMSTLPVIWPVQRVKYLGYIFIISLLTLFIPLVYKYLRLHDLLLTIYLTGLVISLLYLAYYFHKASTKEQFHRMSQFLKIFMLQGLLMLLLL